MIRCQRCGAELRDGARFCDNCGFPRGEGMASFGPGGVVVGGNVQGPIVTGDGNVVAGRDMRVGTPGVFLGTSAEDLRRGLRELRESVDRVIAQGQIPNAGDAKDVQDALRRAEGALSGETPQGKRALDKLKKASDILTRTAEAVKAAGKVGLEVTALAPIAAALWRMAVKLFGGG